MPNSRTCKLPEHDAPSEKQVLEALTGLYPWCSSDIGAVQASECLSEAAILQHKMTALQRPGFLR